MSREKYFATLALVLAKYETISFRHGGVFHIRDATQRRGLVIFRERIGRSIPFPKKRMNRPFASWNSFTRAWKKDATQRRLYKEEVGGEGGGRGKRKRTTRGSHDGYASVAIPVLHSELGEFHVMHRESGLHASNGKRGKITLPFCRLDLVACARARTSVYLSPLFIFTCIKQIDRTISRDFTKVFTAVYPPVARYSRLFRHKNKRPKRIFLRCA